MNYETYFSLIKNVFIVSLSFYAFIGDALTIDPNGCAKICVDYKIIIPMQELNDEQRWIYEYEYYTDTTQQSVRTAGARKMVRQLQRDSCSERK